MDTNKIYNIADLLKSKNDPKLERRLNRFSKRVKRNNDGITPTHFKITDDGKSYYFTDAEGNALNIDSEFANTAGGGSKEDLEAKKRSNLFYVNRAIGDFIKFEKEKSNLELKKAQEKVKKEELLPLPEPVSKELTDKKQDEKLEKNKEQPQKPKPKRVIVDEKKPNNIGDGKNYVLKSSENKEQELLPRQVLPSTPIENKQTQPVITYPNFLASLGYTPSKKLEEYRNKRNKKEVKKEEPTEEVKTNDEKSLLQSFSDYILAPERNTIIPRLIDLFNGKEPNPEETESKKMIDDMKSKGIYLENIIDSEDDYLLPLKKAIKDSISTRSENKPIVETKKPESSIDDKKPKENQEIEDVKQTLKNPTIDNKTFREAFLRLQKIREENEKLKNEKVVSQKTENENLQKAEINYKPSPRFNLTGLEELKQLYKNKFDEKSDLFKKQDKLTQREYNVTMEGLTNDYHNLLIKPDDMKDEDWNKLTTVEKRRLHRKNVLNQFKKLNDRAKRNNVNVEPLQRFLGGSESYLLKKGGIFVKYQDGTTDPIEPIYKKYGKMKVPSLKITKINTNSIGETNVQKSFKNERPIISDADNVTEEKSQLNLKDDKLSNRYKKLNRLTNIANATQLVAALFPKRMDINIKNPTFRGRFVRAARLLAPQEQIINESSPKTIDNTINAVSNIAKTIGERGINQQLAMQAKDVYNQDKVREIAERNQVNREKEAFDNKVNEISNIREEAIAKSEIANYQNKVNAVTGFLNNLVANKKNKIDAQTEAKFQQDSAFIRMVENGAYGNIGDLVKDYDNLDDDKKKIVDRYLSISGFSKKAKGGELSRKNDSVEAAKVNSESREKIAKLNLLQKEKDRLMKEYLAKLKQIEKQEERLDKTLSRLK